MAPNQDIKPNIQQTIAVEHNGTARVMAAAGTGKTRTMGFRVQRLIKKDKYSPRKIVVMTFTRKGADQFRTKLVDLIGKDDAQEVSIGTFHRIASQEVLAFLREKGQDRFHILDETDSEDLWLQAFAEVARESLPTAFGEEIFTGTKKGNKELERKIKSIFKPLRELRSFQINQNLKGEDFGVYGAERLAKQSASFRDIRSHERCPDMTDFIRRCLARYEASKEIHKARDYDDLLVMWRDLLAQNEDYRWGIHQKWVHVIVDEYQDTNYLQEDIIGLLNTKNLVVVGDLSQCIYSWRCAVPQLMIDFKEKYEAIDIPLEYNYRSRDEILDFANQILIQHHNLLSKSNSIKDLPLLQLKGTRGGGGKVEFLPGQNKHDETARVFSRVTRMLQVGVPPEDIVILSRTSYYTRELEAKLRGLQVGNQPLPIQVWGGMSLLDSKTAKDLLAILKAVVRPLDPSPFMRVAQIYAGVGEVAAKTAFFRHVFCLPHEGVLDPFIRGISDLIQMEAARDGDARARLRTVVQRASTMLADAYALSGMESKEFKSRKREIEDMISGINEVITNFQEPIMGSGKKVPPELADIIDRYTLDPKRDKNEEKCLTLSTVHQAKGLEWPHVIVMGVAEGTLPIIRKAGESDIEEECRILYVAATRAEESLTMSYDMEAKRSRFIGEVAECNRACDAAERKLLSQPFI